jgi:hypothetical protein
MILINFLYLLFNLLYLCTSIYFLKIDKFFIINLFFFLKFNQIDYVFTFDFSYKSKYITK